MKLQALARLANLSAFTQDDIAIGGTVIYKDLDTNKYKLSTAVSKPGWNKIKVKNGDVVPTHEIVSTDASDWKTFKDKRF